MKVTASGGKEQLNPGDCIDAQLSITPAAVTQVERILNKSSRTGTDVLYRHVSER
jgi:hypothetical protein